MREERVFTSIDQSHQLSTGSPLRPTDIYSVSAVDNAGEATQPINQIEVTNQGIGGKKILRESRREREGDWLCPVCIRTDTGVYRGKAGIKGMTKGKGEGRKWE